MHRWCTSGQTAGPWWLHGRHGSGSGSTMRLNRARAANPNAGTVGP